MTHFTGYSVPLAVISDLSFPSLVFEKGEIEYCIGDEYMESF